MLKKLLSLQMAEVVTDKATLIYDADKLEVGIEVYVADETNEDKVKPAEDGEYITENETVIVVKEGKVAEIIEKTVEETSVEDTNVEDTNVEETIEVETEQELLEPAEEPIDEVIIDEVVEMPSEKLDEILMLITELTNKVNTLEGKIGEMEERLLKVETEPIAEPITENETIEEETKLSKLSYLRKNKK